MIRIGGIKEMWKGKRLVLGYVDDNSRLKSVYAAPVRGREGFAIGKGFRKEDESYPKLVIRGFVLGSRAGLSGVRGAPIVFGIGEWVDAEYK